MTPKERYIQKLADINSDYNSARKQAMIDFAKEKNIYNIGDIIEDHISKLEIKKIGYYLTEDDPQCIYYGVRLTKKGTENKRENSPVYASNILNK